jgi:hypothetical protein
VPDQVSKDGSGVREREIERERGKRRGRNGHTQAPKNMIRSISACKHIRTNGNQLKEMRKKVNYP